jgi:hypothetical protein
MVSEIQAQHRMRQRFINPIVAEKFPKQLFGKVFALGLAQQFRHIGFKGALW